MRRIGVIGTRRKNSWEDFVRMKSGFINQYKKGDWIVSGGCPAGGDKFAERIARENGIPIITFHPNWEKYGKRAGFVRNTDIAKYSNILIAMVADDRKGGTEDTIRKFEKFSISVPAILVF